MAKNYKDAPCIICGREGVQMGVPHPTRKCGFLWTLTTAGLKWLREQRSKQQSGSGATTALVDTGVTGWEAEDVMCELCAYAGTDDTTLAIDCALAASCAQSSEPLILAYVDCVTRK